MARTCQRTYVSECVSERRPQYADDARDLHEQLGSWSSVSIVKDLVLMLRRSLLYLSTFAFPMLVLVGCQAQSQDVEVRKVCGQARTSTVNGNHPKTEICFVSKDPYAEAVKVKFER